MAQNFLIRVTCTKLLVVFCLSATLTIADTPPQTLYQRLGGEKTIAKIVDETIDRSATHAQTARSFNKINLVNLKKKIVEHFCQLAEGPCKYSGDEMKLVHKGLDITESEFYGMVEHLRMALDHAQVTESAKNELLKILAPMKRDIVTK